MIEVKVTKKNIKEGKRGQVRFCPIALALKEYYPGADIRVGYKVQIDNRNFRTSQRADNFITKFDSGHKVKPITFRFQEI